MAPKVSIVVPTYNRADLISATLESVIDQTFTDWECIVVDDGSTDDTESVVAAFINRDDRFRYVWQENSSAANARNHGLRLARGEFVLFLDSDDLLVSDAMEWQVEALQNAPNAVLVYGDTFKFFNNTMDEGVLYLEHVPDEEMPSGEAFEALISNSSMYSPLIRTHEIRKAGGFDTSLPSAEDWDMWLTLSKRGKILYIPRRALNYRVHSGNKSANTIWNYRNARRVVEKHLATVPRGKRKRLRSDVRAYFREGYTLRLRQDALEKIVDGDWVEARQILQEMRKLNPWALRSPSLFLYFLWAALLPEDLAPPAWPYRLVQSVRKGFNRLTHIPTSPRVNVALVECLFRAMGRRRGDNDSEVDLSTIERALVIALGDTGDVVMMSPFLRELRRQLPQAHITLITAPSTQSLVTHCPYVDQVLTYQWRTAGRLQGTVRHARALWMASSRLWREQFDLAVVPRWNVDSRHATYLAYLSGASYRLGYSEDVTEARKRVNAGYDLLLTHAVHDTKLRHEVERGLILLEYIGADIEEQGLEFWASDEDAARAEDILASNGLTTDAIIVTLGPGADVPKKVWSAERFAEMTRWLQDQYDAHVLILGESGEEELGGDIEEALSASADSKVHNLIGTTTLGETGALLASAALYIGNDTYLMHMAAAADTPVVEVSCHPLHGPADHDDAPEIRGPWGVPHVVVRPAEPRLPCSGGCEVSTPHCILEISVEDVVNAAQFLIREHEGLRR